MHACSKPHIYLLASCYCTCLHCNIPRKKKLGGDVVQSLLRTPLLYQSPHKKKPFPSRRQKPSRPCLHGQPDTRRLKTPRAPLFPKNGSRCACGLSFLQRTPRSSNSPSTSAITSLPHLVHFSSASSSPLIHLRLHTFIRFLLFSSPSYSSCPSQPLNYAPQHPPTRPRPSKTSPCPSGTDTWPATSR